MPGSSAAAKKPFPGAGAGKRPVAPRESQHVGRHDRAQRVESFVLALLALQQQQVLADRIEARHQVQRAEQQRLRDVEIAPLEVDHAQHVDGVERERRARDDFLVEALREVEASRLLRGQRPLHRLPERGACIRC